MSQASSATGIARAMKTYELANPHYSHCSHCTVNSVHTANTLFTLHTTLCSYSCPFYTLFRPDTALDIIPMLRHFTLHTVCTFIQFALCTQFSHLFKLNILHTRLSGDKPLPLNTLKGDYCSFPKDRYIYPAVLHNAQ